MDRYPLKDYHIPFKNLYETLDNSARHYPNKIAVIDDKGSYTYQEFRNRVDRLAAVLKEQFHMQQQEQLAFVMSNSIHMLTAFYAAMKLGCIALMVNTKFSSYEMDQLLRTMDAKLFIADEEWADKVRSLETFQTCRGLLTEYSPIIPSADYAQMKPTDNPEDTAVIMHTSGTTGMPKGIMVSQQNILEAAYGYQEVQGLDHTAVTVLSVPIFHILGLSCVSTLFVYIGGTLVLASRYKTEDVLEKIRIHKATHFHSVPAIYLDILRSDYPNKDLSSLRVMVCGGAPIHPDDVDAFCRLAPNGRFIRAYGMTETAGSGTLAAVHKGPVKAVPNVAVIIVDADNNEVSPGIVGEVIFIGPCVAQKRWKIPSLPEAYLHSGDVGYMDEKGNIFLIDRLKDIINRGGEKIFPAQIESVILEYPGIQSASVYAVSDSRYGEVPVAAIIPQPDVTLDLDALRQFLKKRIATYERPTQIYIVDHYPVTQNGKIRKAELRRLTEAGQI